MAELSFNDFLGTASRAAANILFLKPGGVTSQEEKSLIESSVQGMKFRVEIFHHHKAQSP